MADVIENRIVEMDFENKDFEKKINQSINSLGKLDKALEFKEGSKGFDKIQNAADKLDFSSITDSVSAIEKSFTTLAGSLERNFFDAISSKIVSLGEELTNSTIGQIISGGKTRALNIEAAKFKVTGLNADWSEVYKDMDYAVSGTAYGIDEAANAASQFLASGVQTGEEMKAALRGISGVAAMTSSSYSEIADIFTSAAGKGRVQAMELNRISLHGINAAAELAKALNTTENEVRDMASNGQIDFQTFAYAMDDAFGEHAKEANKTFTGSLSNVKAALSRIGEIWYEPWLQSMIPILNQLRSIIDSYKNALKTPLDSNGNTIATALNDIMTAASDAFVAWSKTWQPLLDNLPFQFEDLFNTMNKVTNVLNTIAEAYSVYKEMQGESQKYDIVDAIQNEAEATGKSIDWMNSKLDEYLKEKTSILSDDVLKKIDAETEKYGGDIHKYVELVEAAYDDVKDAAEEAADVLSDVNSAVAQMSKEEQAYWQAYNYRSLFDAPGVALKDYYNTFLNINNDIAVITSKLGSNTVSLTQTTASSVAQALDTYKAVWDAQNNTLKNSMNVYSEWSTKYSLTFKTLQKNLKSNKEGLTLLAKDMATLVKKGASKELLNELKAQGASGGELVHALAQASKGELKQYEKDRKALTDLQKSTTDDWTKEEKTKYEETISKLVGFSGVTIEEAKEMYNGIFKQMGIENAESYSSGVSSVYGSIENTISTLESTMEKYKDYVSSGSSGSSDIKKETDETIESQESLIQMIAKVEGKFPGILTFIESLDKFALATSDLFSGIFHIFDGIVRLAAEAFGDVFKTFKPDVFSLVGLIDNVAYSLQNIDFSGELGESIKAGFRGIFSLFELGRYVIDNFLGFLNNIFFPGVEEGAEETVPFIVRLFGALGEFIYEVVQVIEQGGTLPDILYMLGDSFGSIFENVSNLLTGNGETSGIIGFFDSIINIVSNAINTISGFMFGTTREDGSGGLFDSILYVLFGDGETSGIITAISSVVEEIIWGASTGTNAISGLVDAVANILSSAGNLLADQTGNISTFLNDIFGFIHNMFVNLSKDENGGTDGAKETFLNIFNAFADIIRSIANILTSVEQPLIHLIDAFVIVVDAIAYMIAQVAAWVGDDPETAYGGAAFIILALAWYNLTLAIQKSAGVIASLKTALTAASRTMNMGILISTSETIFDKIQKLGIAIGVMLIGVAAVVYALAKVFETVGGGEDLIMVVVIAATFVLSTILVLILLVIAIQNMFLKILKTGDKLNPKKAIEIWAIGNAINNIMQGFATAFGTILVGIILLSAAITAILKFGETEGAFGLIAAVLIIGLIIFALYKIIQVIVGSVAWLSNAQKSVGAAMFGLAAILFVLAITIGAIIVGVVALTSVITALFIATESPGAVIGALALAALIIGEIMMGIMGVIVIATKAAATTNVNVKIMFGLAVVLIVLGDAIKQILLAATAMIAAVAAGDIVSKSLGGGAAGTGGAGAVLGMLFFIFAFIMALFAEIAYISTKITNTKQFIAMAAIMAVLISVITKSINEMILGIIGLSLVNINENTLSIYTRMIIFVGVMIAAFMGAFILITKFMNTRFDADNIFKNIAIGFAAIAFAVAQIATAIYKLSQALIVLAKAWPQIKDTIPQMVDDLNSLTPKLGKLLGNAITVLCKVIITKAPTIATAIVVLAVTVINLFNQKIPIIVSSWILLIGEILDIILWGLTYLRPKITNIVDALLDFLDEQAPIWTYHFVTIMLNSLEAGLGAIYDFLVDKFEPFSDLISDWLGWLHEQVTKVNFNIKSASTGTFEEVRAKLSDAFVTTSAWITAQIEIGKAGIEDLKGNTEEAHKMREEAVNKYNDYIDTNSFATKGKARLNVTYGDEGQILSETVKLKAEWDEDKWINDWMDEYKPMQLEKFTTDYDFASDTSITDHLLKYSKGELENALAMYGAAEEATEKEKDLLLTLVATGVISAGSAVSSVKKLGKGSFNAGMKLIKSGEAGIWVNKGAASALGWIWNEATQSWIETKADEGWSGKYKDLKNTSLGKANEAQQKSLEPVSEKAKKAGETLTNYRDAAQQSLNEGTSGLKEIIGNVTNWVKDKTGNSEEAISDKLKDVVDTDIDPDALMQDMQNQWSEMNNGQNVILQNPDVSFDDSASEQIVSGALTEFGGGASDDIFTEYLDDSETGSVDGTEVLNYADGTSTYGEDYFEQYMNNSNGSGGNWLGYDASSDAYQTSSYQGLSSESVNTLSSAISALQSQVEVLISTIGESIIMPQDTDINITTEIDKQAMASTVYPILRSFTKEDDALEADGLAPIDRTYTGSYGSPDFSVKLRR